MQWLFLGLHFASQLTSRYCGLQFCLKALSLALEAILTSLRG